MHPFERLRYVARGGVDDPAVIALEAADGLAALARQPEALVTACRRLLEFHPECGPLWWLSARVLASGDPAVEARCCAGDLEEDSTPFTLAEAVVESPVTVLLPAELTVTWLSIGPDRAVKAVVPYAAFGSLARDLHGVVDELEVFDLSDAEAAVEGTRVLLLEAVAAGPAGVLVRQLEPGSAVDDLVAEATAANVPTWAVCGVGRVLPPGLFGELRERVENPAQGGRRGGRPQTCLVPVEALSQVVRPDGCLEAASALSHPDCPPAAELLVRAR